uniref:Uncharacterized protein n=1 Tax=Eutreptiella gymnastica TaxID=73025 RepID=A0A7S1IU83_9EUGL
MAQNAILERRLSIFQHGTPPQLIAALVKSRATASETASRIAASEIDSVAASGTSPSPVPEVPSKVVRTWKRGNDGAGSVCSSVGQSVPRVSVPAVRAQPPSLYVEQTTSCGDACDSTTPANSRVTSSPKCQETFDSLPNYAEAACPETPQSSRPSTSCVKNLDACPMSITGSVVKSKKDVQSAFQALNRSDLIVLRQLVNPTQVVKDVLGAVCILFGISPIRKQGAYSRELKSYIFELDYFGALRKHLQRPNAFWAALQRLDPETLDPQVVEQTHTFIAEKGITEEAAAAASQVCRNLLIWVNAILEAAQSKSCR